MSLEVRDLSFGYDSRLVLKNLSFTAEYGQLLSVLGPNGVGKSTLFRCILGLLKPKSGECSIDGNSTVGLNAKELSQLIAYIPQSHYPTFNFSVFDMVLMGTTAQISAASVPGKRQIALADEALERLGIAHLKNRGYTNISGGERQLVLIARALVQQAKILIMDEPSANLDYGNRTRVMQTVRTLTKEGYAIIQSTHDPDQAFLYSDRVLAVYDGQVLSCGTPKEVINSELISKLYGVDVEISSLHDDRVRVCIPKNIGEYKSRSGE